MSKHVDKATAYWSRFVKEAKRHWKRRSAGTYERLQYNRAFRRWAKRVSGEAGGPLDD